MAIKLIVRKGFGKIPKDINTLSNTEKDRLTSRTRNIAENLAVEFYIEEHIRKIGDSLRFIFVESDIDTLIENSLDLRKKELSWDEELKMIYILGLPIPLTKKVSEATKADVFPCIIKNPESRKGKEVFQIDSFKTFGIFQKFLTSSTVLIPSIANEIIHYDPTIEREKFIYQQYVSTPSEFFTSYRVMVSCAGDVITSALLYSENSKNSKELLQLKNKGKISKNTDILVIPDSPFFINSQKVVSNISQGGGIIVLEPAGNSKEPTDVEKCILKDHNINSDTPRLPEAIKEKSKLIGKYLGESGIGLFYGIDWVQSKDGEYFYLETNLSPMCTFYVNAFMKGVGTHEEAYVLIADNILRQLLSKSIS